MIWTSKDAFYHCINICFAKNNFPSDKTLVALFTDFFWRPFCFRSHNSAPPTTVFLDLFRASMMFSYSKIPVSFLLPFFFRFFVLRLAYFVWVYKHSHTSVRGLSHYIVNYCLLISNEHIFHKFRSSLIQHLVQIHYEITKNKDSTILNNTMYTGAAQADVTTAAVNVIMMSRTTYFLKYTLWCVLYLWWRLTYFW